jgi:hypothetical protein
LESTTSGLNANTASLLPETPGTAPSIATPPRMRQRRARGVRRAGGDRGLSCACCRSRRCQAPLWVGLAPWSPSFLPCYSCHVVEHFLQGSCWIPGSYTPCTGLKHLILNGFFQRCRIARDPRRKPVKTTCYAKLDELRPWNPI